MSCKASLSSSSDISLNLRFHEEKNSAQFPISSQYDDDDGGERRRRK